MLQDIKDFSLESLKTEMKQMGEPAYRANQVFRWLYKKGIRSFEEMTDVSASLKEKLNKKFIISTPVIVKKLRDHSGTEKLVFCPENGIFIESVIIPSKTRNTLCVSVQAGCRYGCKFCASGKRFIRNLTTGEMSNQVSMRYFIQKSR